MIPLKRGGSLLCSTNALLAKHVPDATYMAIGVADGEGEGTANVADASNLNDGLQLRPAVVANHDASARVIRGDPRLAVEARSDDRDVARLAGTNRTDDPGRVRRLGRGPHGGRRRRRYSDGQIAWNRLAVRVRCRDDEGECP
jgi:hypothetical protein